METTSTTAAAPCRLCGTHAGYRNPRTGEPNRTRNLCEACYIRERRAGRLDRWWPKRRRTVHLVAHACPQCGATFHDYAARHRTYCSHRCQYAAMGAERPAAIPTGLITLASRGIRGDIPPTDPALTPAKVMRIGNTNIARAAKWLAARGGGVAASLSAAIWEPARLDAERRAA